MFSIYGFFTAVTFVGIVLALVAALFVTLVANPADAKLWLIATLFGSVLFKEFQL
jgi:hypothetical protein